LTTLTTCHDSELAMAEHTQVESLESAPGSEDPTHHSVDWVHTESQIVSLESHTESIIGMVCVLKSDSEGDRAVSLQTSRFNHRRQFPPIKMRSKEAHYSLPYNQIFSSITVSSIGAQSMSKAAARTIYLLANKTTPPLPTPSTHTLSNCPSL
jgi:hypothetical protein